MEGQGWCLDPSDKDAAWIRNTDDLQFGVSRFRGFGIWSLGVQAGRMQGASSKRGRAFHKIRGKQTPKTAAGSVPKWPETPQLEFKPQTPRPSAQSQPPPPPNPSPETLQPGP